MSLIANEKVTVYLDAADKWRWRWVRGSRIVADSAQGYVQKRDALLGLEAITRSEFHRTYESRRNETKRAYQQGFLRNAEGDIFVEVTPWGEDGP